MNKTTMSKAAGQFTSSWLRALEGRQTAVVSTLLPGGAFFPMDGRQAHGRARG